MARQVVYIAGPYSSDTSEGVSENIAQARELALRLWKVGFAPICPHLNTAHFSDPKLTYEDYLEGDFDIILRCDFVVAMSTWERSKGATREIAFAKEHKIPVLYWGTDVITPHVTVYRAPDQVRGFMAMIMRMYRIHLDKNRDYSPANIMGGGEVGVVTRAWDKMCRLMYLSGFNITISQPATYEKPREAVNEPLEDTLVDLANYAIINQLLRWGMWGH